MENIMRYRLSDGQVMLQSKKESTPHIFECQQRVWKRAPTRSYLREHKKIISEAFDEPGPSIAVNNAVPTKASDNISRSIHIEYNQS